MQRPGQRAGLAVLCALLFLTFLDNTIVSVALGAIQPDLHAGVSDLQWVVNGYALTFAAFMLFFGVVGDQFGRKAVMLGGVSGFCAGSVICAVAPSSSWLIAGRAVMGIGAAASEPGTLSMLRHLYRDSADRAWAVGVWTAIAGVALALGPVVGGILVGAAGWRSIFWFNLAAGVLLVALAASVLPESADPRPERIDLPGAVLIAGGLGALVYAVIDGEIVGYQDSAVIALFVIGLAAVVGFTLRERHAARPLLDLDALRRPGFGIANVIAFATYFGTFAIFFFTALYLTEVDSASGFRIAELFAPMTVALVGASLITGRYVGHHQLWLPITFGCLVFCAGLALTAVVLHPHTPTVPLMLTLAAAGLGVGGTLVPVTHSALNTVPEARSGMAASATNTSRELGAVIGVAVLGAIVDAQLTGHLLAAMRRLGIPGNFQSIVIKGVEQGQLTGQRAHAAEQSFGSLARHVINAAYAAFGTGLRTALAISAGLALFSAVLAVVALRPKRR